MNISINLDKDFENKLHELEEKYGEEITRTNGFAADQLDHTKFISNFIDSYNVADATIDPNANQSTKDIRSLLDEMNKPQQKLLSMNKIYYEVKKKYGKAVADEWFENDFSGATYLHDAPSSSFYSYCILPNECCTFIYNGRYIDCSMQDIYNIVDEREFYDAEAGVHYKIPKNLKVQDLDKNTGEIRYTKVSMVSKKNTDERFFFTKLYNGMNLITTENHQFIGETSDTAAKDIVENETKAYSAFDNKKFTNSIEYYHGIPMNEDFGYLVGMYLAEGYNTRGQLSICQDFEKSKDTCVRIIEILDKYNMPYKLYPNSNIIRLKNGENNWERRLLKVFKGKYCDEKRLCEDYIHFSDKFLIGFLAGIIDGDGTVACNRTLMIRMTSRTLINQIRSIGLHFGVYFGSRLPYIQSQEAKIQQKRPMYSANVNMNRNRDFFLSLPSHKISEKFTNYEYDESSANKNYVCELGYMKVRDCKQTYKPTNTVYDLSTETHTFICNDILIHNCYAYELQNLAEKGLYFLPKSNTYPPKHMTTFFAHLREFIVWVSNRTSGACALPSFFIYSYYFWKKDVEAGYYLKDPEYYRRQMFQQFIFEVNQIHTRITQSAYTNLIIMDRPYIEELFGTRQFPDGTFVMDYIDEIIEHEKAFMETEAEIRKSVFHTFPVFTYALLFQNGKFVDEEFARWCNKNNLQWYDSNFYIGDSVTNLASCCFDGKQLCLTRSSLGGVKLLSFKDFCEASYKDTKTNLKIFHNGSWVNGNVVKLPKKQMYKIVTANKKELYVTEDHVFPTDSGDKMVKDITTDDFLLFNTRRLDSFPEADKGLTYEQGFFIGMYLGDGSSQKREEFTPVINLSLNRQKYERTIDILSKAIGRIDEDVEVKLGKPYDNVYPVTIRSWLVYNFMREYVSGNYSYEKELNMDCLLQSYDFRRGILDGYYATDGGNSNRIHTTSEKLVPQVEALITSLGMNSVIDVSDRTDEPVIIRGEEYERHYPLHCIRWYSQTNKRNFGGVYKVVNNNEYFKVASIEKYDSDDDYVYCFNMKNEDEPYFTLPNGVISHNCRMLNDLSKQKQFRSSIGGSLVEIGSVKVSTINLMRIALESGGDKDKFIEILKHRVNLNMQVLDCVRHIIQRNIEKGLLPNYSYGVINLEKQTTTNGLTAMYEAIREMGMIETDKFGNVSYTDEGIEFASKIMDTVNELQDNAGFDYNVSLEIIPAESANVKLCHKDNILYNRHDDFIYSNQWTSLMAQTQLKTRIKLSAILDKKAGGGQILHVSLDGNQLTEEQSWEILNYMANAGVIYFAFNPKLSLCKHKHTFFGETCPICGEKKEDEVTRCVGYLVPVSSYSAARRDEENHRQWYSVGEDIYL